VILQKAAVQEMLYTLAETTLWDSNPGKFSKVVARV
jgi:hypothetical protein